MVKTYHIPSYDATILTGEKALADFFEECAVLYSDAKTISNWVIGDLLRWLHEDEWGIEASKITSKMLVSMIALIDEGVISGKIAKRILPEIIRTGKSPQEIVEEKGLLIIGSLQEIEDVVNHVFKENSEAVQDALLEDKAIHYLVGQVMKATRGRADPELTNQIVKVKLEKLERPR